MKDLEFSRWEALCARLGREPTPDELREECERIMAAMQDCEREVACVESD